MEQKPAQAQETAPAREERAGDEQASIPYEKPTIMLDFRVWVTRSQMLALREFLVSNGIKFGKVPRESEE